MAAIFKRTFFIPRCKDCKCPLNIECNIGYNEQFFSRFDPRGKRRLSVVLDFAPQGSVIVAAILTCRCPNKQIDDTLVIFPSTSPASSETQLKKWIILNTIGKWALTYGCL